MFKTQSNTPQFHSKHETHKETIIKFLALVVIIMAYFSFMSWKYNASIGFEVTILTWSFFVLCTPVADGGFILAFPIRLLFGIKMSVTQIVLWFVAVGLNVFMLAYSPDSYNLTFLTKLLKKIITEPYPYWSILIISAIGTLLSIYFGDEMMDVTLHKNREKHHQHGFHYRIILILGLGFLTVFAYYHLLSTLNITLPS